MKYWKKLSNAEISERVFTALDNNISFIKKKIIGIPASTVDQQVFNINAPFLKNAPFMTAMVNNPNHIGCHTLGQSETFSAGTHEIEKDVIKIVANDILSGGEEDFDGYVASGGTEANIQAIWIYRNFFKYKKNAKQNEIAIITSEDAHYSMPKAANLLNIPLYSVKVDENNRKISQETLHQAIQDAEKDGIKYFIIVANMGTTMFGSVDNPDLYTNYFKKHKLQFKLHIDAAFGGFIYPISNPENNLNFANPDVISITIDAHKMLDAPYGTGIFVVRKNWMQYVMTKEAGYINGMDITLVGSRSGANAIATWMILQNYGPFGWLEEINKLLYRTDYLCKKLDEKNIQYFREDKFNIVAIKSKNVPQGIQDEYYLVPETHDGKHKWAKIVVMPHVTLDILEEFLSKL